MSKTEILTVRRRGDTKMVGDKRKVMLVVVVS
jgi:hypothetical protein